MSKTLVQSENQSQKVRNSPSQQPHQGNLVNFINFNQDFSCISIGTKTGYKIYNCKPFGKCFNKVDGSMGIVEMLFCTSLICVVGLGDQPNLTPRRLKIINTKKQSTIVELTFPTTILSIKLNKSRMIVLLEEQIYIYDITNMRLLHSIETSPNPQGICTLSSNSAKNYLAYPSPPKLINSILTHGDYSSNHNQHTTNNLNANSNTTQSPSRTGDVIIFNAQTLQPLSVIEAHKSKLAALSLSSDGLLLATASDKGTIVRVFSVETGIKLYQFRRGTYPTKIYSISFSNDNKFVVVTSATETVHIFRLGEEESVAFKNKKKNNLAKKKTMDSSIIEEEEFEFEHGNNSENLLNHHGTNSDDESDDSDEEGEFDEEELTEQINQMRRSSQSSQNSFNSTNSNNEENRNIPLIDNSRKSVARMIRRSSQTLGRKAAEKMGIYLPSRFSSILEPTRHFASLKIPIGKDVKSIAAISDEMLDWNMINENNSHQDIESINSKTSSHLTNNDENDKDSNLKLLNVMVVTSDGYFYKFGLDSERGGDCILLNQYSLLEHSES